ncbi:MAG: hypothetical protein OXH92_11890 [Bryobacterales bacterium]|nr:hypothetical protein [bacterium]MDE0434695.1 hypothetical protein [Bryobacterales bacterium]
MGERVLGQLGLGQRQVAGVNLDHGPVTLGTADRLEVQIAETRATVWKAVIAGAGLVVLLNKFLDWIIK